MNGLNWKNNHSDQVPLVAVLVPWRLLCLRMSQWGAPSPGLSPKNLGRAAARGQPHLAPSSLAQSREQGLLLVLSAVMTSSPAVSLSIIWGSYAPNPFYSLLLLVPAGPQTRAEGELVHRKNFFIFLCFLLFPLVWEERQGRPSARRVLVPGVGFVCWLLLVTSL